MDKDPMGWEDAETEIGRSEATYGIFLTITNNLEFTGKAIRYLENNYQLRGVQANVRLTKHVKNDYTDEWQLSFTGFLDFSTRRIENNRFIIDFIEGGLREILTSQIREKFELNRTTTIKGASIPSLVTDKLDLKGREIFLLSKLRNENVTTFDIKSGIWRSGDARVAYRPAPLTVTANTDPDNIQTPVEMVGTAGQHLDGSATKFFNLADRDRSWTKVRIKMKFRISDVYRDASSAELFQVVLKPYTDRSQEGGDLYHYEPETDKVLIGPFNPRDRIGHTFEVDVTYNFRPKEGDSYALLFFTRGEYGRNLGTDSGQMQVFIDNYEGSIDWEEDSEYQPTVADFITANDVGSRLTQIYTGKNQFQSHLLSNQWSGLGFTNGGWIRNLKTSEGNEWPLTISWEDFYKSIDAVTPVAYGIITRGSSQFIALEDRRYFFQPYVTIKLGQVSDVKRSTATEFVYSSITTGYSKGGNYEKPLGLDEYNTQSSYITPVTVLENKYEAIGEARADSYGVEDARRKPYSEFPDEDTPYDQDNFIVDAKVQRRSNQRTTWEVRTWEDDFDTPPTGVYSPDTTFNLRLSPAQNRNRHSKWFNSALWKFQDEMIRFASSEGNSELETDVKENSDVQIGSLSQPMFEPEWIECEHPLSQEVQEQLQGHTRINGEMMNNYYGQVEFINEDGVKERAYLFSAKIQNTVTLKMLKSYGG